MGRKARATRSNHTGAQGRIRNRTAHGSGTNAIHCHQSRETLSGRGLEGREHVDLAIRLSPLDPLFYGMLGTRSFTHMAQGEDLEAASWAERAARAPGAHVLIAMIAAVAHSLAGHAPEARSWANNVRERKPSLTRGDFFRAFPIKSEAMHRRLSAALQSLGF